MPDKPPPDLDALLRYRQKRDFTKTSEPESGALPAAAGDLTFVVQQHRATRMHWDFRLEVDGVLVSWAVPKGPSLNPKDKRMAASVEDHPFDYGGFEGVIPKQNYGAGEVIVGATRPGAAPACRPRSPPARSRSRCAAPSSKARGRSSARRRAMVRTGC
jgi:bifunctional non-homologous end joining protein LigD